MLSLILTILFFALLGFIAYIIIIKFAFVIGLFSLACWIADKLFK